MYCIKYYIESHLSSKYIDLISVLTKLYLIQIDKILAHFIPLLNSSTSLFQGLYFETNLQPLQ